MRHALPLLFLPALLLAQGRGVPPAELLNPLANDWTTYNGDYSGRRFSALTQVDRSNVKSLSLAWMTRLTGGPGNPQGGRGGRGGFGGPSTPVIVGGEGTGDLNVGGGAIKCSV